MDDFDTILIHELKFTKNPFFNYAYIFLIMYTHTELRPWKLLCRHNTQVYIFLLENIKNLLKIVKVGPKDQKKCSSTRKITVYNYV